MLIKSLTLLLLVAALLEIPATLAQQRDLAQRRQQLLQRQAKQQEQGNKRRLVSRTRVNVARKQTAAPEEPVPTLTTVPLNQDAITTQALTTPTLATQAATTPVFNLPTEPTPVNEDVQPVQEPEVDSFVNQAPVRTRARPQTRPVSQPKPTAQEVTSNRKPVAAKSNEEKVEKKPNVETIRRYSFENEDGSFTFGYENADGSFKEETRGADCVVRGKYGYIDPEGVRREFSYVSGNPCDPNKKDEEEEERVEEGPVAPKQPQIPSRPNIQRRPNIPNIPNIPDVPRPAPRPVQQTPQSAVLPTEEAEEELLEVLRNPELRPRPKAPEVNSNTRIQRPRPVNPPRPVEPVRNEEPEILPPQPRPQARPAIVPVAAPSPINTFNFEEEIQRFGGQQRQTVPAVQRPVPQTPRQEQDRLQLNVRPTGSRSFTSELVFDPNTNQFRTAVVQRIPEASTEISIRESLIGFVSTTTTTTPRPETTTTVPVTTPAPRVVQEPARPPVQPERRPPVNPEPEFDFDSFGPPRQQIERQQQQRPQFPFAPPSFNPQGAGFRQQQPQFAFEQDRRPQFFPAPNPFAPGIPPQQFFRAQPSNPPQPQQFAPVQVAQPQNPQIRTQPRPPVQATNVAAGQIDSFLSTLG